MNKEQTELLDSMVEGFLGDIQYEFDLDTEGQAKRLVEQSLERQNV